MIKTERGNTRIEGEGAEIYADLICLIKAVKSAFEEKNGAEEAETMLTTIFMMSMSAKEEDFL